MWPFLYNPNISIIDLAVTMWPFFTMLILVYYWSDCDAWFTMLILVTLVGLWRCFLHNIPRSLSLSFCHGVRTAKRITRESQSDFIVALGPFVRRDRSSLTQPSRGTPGSPEVRKKGSGTVECRPISPQDFTVFCYRKRYGLRFKIYCYFRVEVDVS